MRPEDLLYWLKAQPFRPFIIKMVSGAEYQIMHPEFVKVMRTSFVVYWPTEETDVFERAEMLGLQLVENIKPIDATTAA
ncbi:MAG: hypothetical protein HYR84_02200 [Planctomycetes bacterium]|nr:hypothetical protein [Planctomycetota bacterium]